MSTTNPKSTRLRKKRDKASLALNKVNLSKLLHLFRKILQTTLTRCLSYKKI